MNHVLRVSAVILAFGASADAAIRLTSLANWDIVVAPDASITERYAADELRDALRHAIGTELPIVTSVSRANHHVFVGPSDAMQRAEIGFSAVDYQDEELRVVIDDENIAIAGGRPRGTLYGVYSFLEDYLGVRYLTCDHTHVPKLTEQHVVGPVDKRFNPPLSFRWSFYRETNVNPPFATRLRINTVGTGCSESVPSDPKLGGKSLSRLVNHSFFGQVSSLDYGAEHPEYYCMREGKRWLANPDDRRPQNRQNQPCMTNPDVLEIVTARTLAELALLTDYITVSVAQNDNDRFCQCPSCEAINSREGAPMGSLLHFVNAVADVAAAEYPEYEIGTLAYQFSRKPPEHLRARPNVRVQLCSIECCPLHALDDPQCPKNAEFMRDLAGWDKITDRLSIWHYQANFSDYTLIYPGLLWVDRNVRTFVARNVDGIFMQAAGETVSGAMSDLYNYVIAGVLWDPSRDAQQLTEEFIRLHYGSAAEPIQRFIDLVHEKAAASGLHARCFGGASRFGLDDPAIAEASLAAFAEALQLADNPAVRERVEKASIAGVRLALEPAFVAMKNRQSLADDEVARLTPLAKRYLDLCARFNVDTLKSNGTSLEWAAHGLTKVLNVDELRPKQ